MGKSKSLKKIELDELIKQILKIKENKEDAEKKKEKLKEKELEELESSEFEQKNNNKKNLSDFLKKIEKENNEMEFSELTHDLFMKDIMPVSYKLEIHYGGEVFEGYYERAMESVKKTKETTYSSMGREMETETLQNSLKIIRNAKENKSDNLILDSSKKAAVDAYKWQSITWWQILYELEGKVIF